MNKEYKKSSYFINSFSEFSLLEFKNIFAKILKSKQYKYLIFLCIGTDRSTGDSLGPLVGYKLCKLPLPKNVIILGSLEKPVHAKNLNKYIKLIYKYKKKDSLIIAIDASLGDKNFINYINIGEGSIKPGAGLKKNLPYVGDMYITGIVNTKGILEFSILQNTRLKNVMKMADIISSGIWHCLNA